MGKSTYRRGRAAIIAIVNERWRVGDDGLAWILEVRKGRKSDKATGWRDLRFAASGPHYCAAFANIAATQIRR